MRLNFYRKLNISDGETILLENPTRSFQANFISNVPKHCTVLYKYKNTPVDIVLFWIDKRDSEEEIMDQIKELLEKIVQQGVLWVMFDLESKGKEPILLEYLKEMPLTISKKMELYKDIYSIKLVKQ